MVEYINSSYTNNYEDRKSISRYYFFFGGVIMTWSSKQ